MSKLHFTAFFVFLTALNQPCFAQFFVNPASRWHVRYCCSSWVSPQVDCSTTAYKLEEVQMVVNGKIYHPLKNLTDGGNNFSALFREIDGKVFRSDDFGSSEVLLYDFNVALGDTVQVGNPNSGGYSLVVAEVDSVSLLSGEKKRRMKMVPISFSSEFTYWIDGIGCERSPLDPRLSFTLDCWYNLSCFYQNNQLAMSFDPSCAATVSTQSVDELTEYVTIAPNPAASQVTVSNTSNHRIEKVLVWNMLGQPQAVQYDPAAQQFDVSNWMPGVYIISVHLANASRVIQNRLVVH